MKYLKKYNENKNDDKLKELKEFCNNYLAYLTDDGYKILYYYNYYITNLTNNLSYDILISKTDDEDDIFNLNDIDDYYLFNNSNIEDYFIPFIEMLKNNYQIYNDEIRITIWDDLVGSNYEYTQNIESFLEKFEQDNIFCIGLTISI